jgi:hypothetical protein
MIPDPSPPFELDASELAALRDQLIAVAQSPTFVSRARALGFTDAQIAKLTERIEWYYLNGQLGWIPTGGYAVEDALLIGRWRGPLPFGLTARMRHELGHLLDDIARPGLMASSLNAAKFGWGRFFGAEMVAFGTQFGPRSHLLWITPGMRRVYFSALTASANRFGMLVGGGGFLVGTIGTPALLINLYGDDVAFWILMQFN